MRRLRVHAFTISLVMGLAAAPIGLGDAHAAGIECGSVLGPGGVFVLDRDLTCPANDPDPNDDTPDTTPALLVVRATLDLNGHTVTCGPRTMCVKIKGATLINGTVSGGNSRAGVRVASNSLVRHVTVSHSLYALWIQGDNNNIVENTAIGSIQAGFEIRGNYNTLVDNRASQNGNGFAAYRFEANRVGAVGKGNVLIGNVAEKNVVGFWIVLQDGTQMIGNRARANSLRGFSIGSTRNLDFIGNVAKGNGSRGRHFSAGIGLTENEDLIAMNNIAKANLGDGFQVSAAWSEGKPQTLTLNRAVSNDGYGIHVQGTTPDPGTVQAVISENIARENQVDLKDDNADCHTAIWQDNTFDTASETCIH